jgi:hypothetical protein
MWFSKYHLVYGSNRLDYSSVLDIRLFLLICLIFFLYKIYIYNVYNMNYTLFSLRKLFQSTTYSNLDKFLNFLVVLFNSTLFLGLGFIWFKVLYIELGYDLIGLIRILPLFVDNLNIYKIWTQDEKYLYILSLIVDRFGCDYSEALEKYSNLCSFLNNVNHLLI